MTQKTKKKIKTSASKPGKHFLDTSVARPILTAGKEYRRYFSLKFGSDRLYVSRFVKMEFRRSFIVSLIKFFFILDLPTVKSVGDAGAVWSNKFKTSELKAVLQIIDQLFATQRLSGSTLKDKESALLALGRLIKRYESLLKEFIDIGTDSPRCARADIVLDIDLEHLRRDLRNFLDRFNDTQTCRSKCIIDHFLLTRYRTEVESYVTLNGSLSETKETKGFKAIAENLAEISTKGPSSCSCMRCERIGDAVIALDTPRLLQIEHTDHSFNQLCDRLGHPHYQHPSEMKVVAIGAKASVS